MFNFKIHICISIAYLLDAYMDHLNFHKLHNTGYWSLHYETKNFIGEDAWHDSKKLKQLFLILAVGSAGMWGFTVFDLILMPVIICVIHETFLHLIFKRRKTNGFYNPGNSR